jgi:hypothetical protein
VSAETSAIFGPYEFGDAERVAMDRDGHYLLPGLLTASACRRLTESLSHIESLRDDAEEGHEPSRFAAEFDDYLASLIGHPQLLELARLVLGDDIRYDHCVALNRPGGNNGTRWHSHEYGEDRPDLGFVRIFFYVNGFEPDDGGLKVVPGSHLFRDAQIHADSDEDLRSGWMAGRSHPQTGEPLQIEALSAPTGTVALMWTHAAHGVNPRRPDSDTRWTVVYAFRNPGLPSRARWLTPEFEQRVIPGAEGLLSLY